MAAGIELRHARSCRSGAGGRCNCEPTYRPWVSQDGRKIRGPASRSLAEAKGWRADAKIVARRGRTVEGQSNVTLEVTVEAWLDGARAGTIRNRSGDTYKPSSVRGYEQTLRLHVLPGLGREPVREIRRADLQELVDRMVANGSAAATIQAVVIPVKSIFRREIELDRLKVNPTVGLRLPAVRGGRDRIADPTEAAQLLTAAPQTDRAIWATAMYAGLRRGELRALRACDVDVPGGLIHVTRGWDDVEGEIETKGRNRRKVPIPAVLKEPLAAHLLRTGRRDDDLVFGLASARAPFEPGKLTARADKAWKKAKLNRITLHECRHSFASLMIAAGVNAKALCDYMGHSSIQVTFDKYGHLMPGNEAEAATLLDTYLKAQAK